MLPEVVHAMIGKARGNLMGQMCLADEAEQLGKDLQLLIRL